MARFDVPVQPENAPQFFHWSKPISDIHPDMSKATLFKDIGDTVEEGTKGLTKFAGEFLQKKSEDVAESKTKQYLTTDEDLYQKTFPGQLPSRATDKTPDTLTPNADDNGYDTAKVPTIIKDKLAGAANMKAAREQGGLPGHIRDTQYYADIYKAASELRAQFPGYRDYIDKGFEKVTGFTPNANAYRKSLLADLNEAYAAKNTEKSKLDGKLAEYNHIYGVADIRDNVDGGKMTISQGWHELAKLTAFKGTAELAESNAKVNSYNNEQLTEQGRTLMQQVVPGIVGTAITGALKSIFPTSESIDSATPDHWRAFGQKLQLAEAGIRNNVDAMLPKNLKPAMGDKYEEALKPYLAELEGWKKAVTDKDIGMMHDLENGKKAMENTLEFNALKNSDWFKSMYLMKQMGGPGFQFTISSLGKDIGFNAPGSPKFPEELKSILNRAATGTMPNNLNNIKQMLGYINKESKGSAPDAAAHIGSIHDAIASPNVPDPMKANLVKYAFGEGTEGWLGNIKDDTIDPATGKQVNGRHAIFWQYSDPKMVESIRKLGPQVFQRYQDWMLNTFKRDIIGGDLKYLSNLPWVRGMTLTLDTPHNGKDPMKFVARPGGNPSLPGEGVARASYGTAPYDEQNIQFNVGKVNYALATLSNVLGPDVANARFMEALHNSGIDTRTRTGQPQTTLDHLILSIGVAGGPKPESTKEQSKVPDLSRPSNFFPPFPKQQGTMNTGANQTPTGGGLTTSQAKGKLTPMDIIKQVFEEAGVNWKKLGSGNPALHPNLTPEDYARLGVKM